MKKPNSVTRGRAQAPDEGELREEGLSKSLATAALQGRPSLVKLLLQQGAQPELGARYEVRGESKERYFVVGEESWTTPWSAAIAADSADCLRAMIEAGMSAVKPRLLIGGREHQDAFLAVEAACDGAERCLELALSFAAEKAPENFQEISSKVWLALVVNKERAGKIEAMARIVRSAGSDIDRRSIEGALGGESRSPLERFAAPRIV